MKRSLGVCYYPEHWPEEIWARDAQQMVETGLTWVRIGEFAWSRLEPQPGQFDWGWLDRAIATLGQAGLKVILGTPTATPPRWMLDKYPDMLGHTSAGEIRKFGSRRHYCFSHAPYRDEARRIARLMAERYGTNPTIAAWQTDNEYDCHDTAISYSVHAKRAFQDWCAQRYQSPQALNAAWGNVFWSMEYDSFDQLDLPNQTVTEPNPSHVLAFRRFSSDQVVLFNRVQCDEIRKYSDRPIIHNFMGRITAFDHYDLGADLDISSWDSYPMGFCSTVWAPMKPRKRIIYARATRTFKPSTMIFTAPPPLGAGGSWSNSPARSTGRHGTQPPSLACRAFGHGRLLPMARKPCAIFAGDKRPSPKSKCTQAYCAPTAAPPRLWRRPPRSPQSWHRCPMLARHAPKLR